MVRTPKQGTPNFRKLPLLAGKASSEWYEHGSFFGLNRIQGLGFRV